MSRCALFEVAIFGVALFDVAFRVEEHPAEEEEHRPHDGAAVGDARGLSGEVSCIREGVRAVVRIEVHIHEVPRDVRARDGHRERHLHHGDEDVAEHDEHGK